MIEQFSESVPKIGGMGIKLWWAKVRLSNAPVLSAGGMIKSVAYGGGTGLFTVTLMEAVPSDILVFTGAERASGHGQSVLNSIDSTRQILSLSWLAAASGAAPALADGATTDFMHLLILAVAR